jgi:hypothetical protein
MLKDGLKIDIKGDNPNDSRSFHFRDSSMNMSLDDIKLSKKDIQDIPVKLKLTSGNTFAQIKLLEPMLQITTPNNVFKMTEDEYYQNGKCFEYNFTRCQQLSIINGEVSCNHDLIYKFEKSNPPTQ